MIEKYITSLYKEHEGLFSDFHALRGEENDYFRRYLKLHSLKDQSSGNARTFLYIENNNNKKQLLGFYSLRASSIIIESEDFVKIGEPAVEIYEFAVNTSVQGNGYGEDLIKDAMLRAFQISKQVGVKHILVCAKHNAMSFYEKYGFKEISPNKDVPRTDSNSGCTAMSLPLSLLSK